MAHILHVDDNMAGRTLVREHLTQNGHTVVSVNTLDLADEELDSKKFDLTIADGSIHQPQDGVRWAEKKEAEGHKIVVLSDEGKSETILCLSKTAMVRDPNWLHRQIRHLI